MKFAWPKGSKSPVRLAEAVPLINVPDADVIDAVEAAAHEGARPNEFSLFRDKPPAPSSGSPTPPLPDKPGLFARRSRSSQGEAGASIEDVLPHEPRAEQPVPDSLESLSPAPAEDSMVAVEKTSTKRFRFGRKAKVKPEPTLEPGVVKRKLSLPKHELLPVHLVVGFLPEVSARDAAEYAMGIAEKHFTQPGLTFYYVTEYDNGWAYEVHEGGNGKAFLPGVLNYFDSRGPFESEEHVSVVLETSTRKVEVLRQRNGLVGLVLPESSQKTQPEWLTANKQMPPVINRQRNFFLTGLVIFATGVIAMGSTALFFRLQGYLPPVPPKVERVSLQETPRAQWTRIEALAGNAAIRAMRFKSDKWQEIELEGAEPPPSEAGLPAAVPLAATQEESPALPSLKTTKEAP